MSKRKRICLVTVEFHGLFKNGGIGTANTALALALAAEGFEDVYKRQRPMICFSQAQRWP